MVLSGRSLGLLSATSIGFGSMIAAGIFSIFGTATAIAGNAVYVAFMIAGIVALLNAYSYSRLGVRYTSPGGPVEFIVRGLGSNTLTGGLNILLWISYIFGLALYAKGFSAYAVTFLPSSMYYISTGFLSVLIIVLFTAINFFGVKFVSGSELFINVFKLVFLLLFSIAGLILMDYGNPGTDEWPPVTDIVYCAGIIFLIFQGFGLISTASKDMKNPRKDLPTAIYLSILIVLVVSLLVSLSVIGNLSMVEIGQAGDYVIAAAARPVLGDAGFRLMALTAVFSISAGINASLYGGANVSYLIARKGELPQAFDRKTWADNREGLFITSGLVILLVSLVDLEGIGIIGSSSLIIIYIAVNLASLRLSDIVHSSHSVIRITLMCDILFLGFNVSYMVHRSLRLFVFFVIVIMLCFLVEHAYRNYSGRSYSIKDTGP